MGFPNLNYLGAQPLIDMLKTLGPQTHPGAATLLAARLERVLEWIIQANMPYLSNRMKPRIFEGYGPLGSFSAKIDIARALGFIDENDSRTLHAIRDIRNKFAHADEELHFHHPAIMALVHKLPTFAKKDPYVAFTDAVSACNESLSKRLDAYNKAILAGAIERS
jgi:DNA-binding MltR family transcriptional regulator